MGDLKCPFAKLSVPFSVTNFTNFPFQKKLTLVFYYIKKFLFDNYMVKVGNTDRYHIGLNKRVRTYSGAESC